MRTISGGGSGFAQYLKSVSESVDGRHISKLLP